MKKALLVFAVTFSLIFSINSYAGIFGGNWFHNSYDGGSTISGVSKSIAGSFNPGGVSIGGPNGKMNGGGKAASGWGTHNFNANKNFYQPSVDDASVSLLSSIFGNVGDVVNGNGVPLLGQLFNIFNTALMGLGVIVITYLVFRGVLDTAAHGEFLGKQMNSVWVPFRVVSGIILLIPRKSGYCVAQILIMYVIVMGVGVADTVWNKALTYFQNGGAMSIDAIQTPDIGNQMPACVNDPKQRDTSACFQKIVKFLGGTVKNNIKYMKQNEALQEQETQVKSMVASVFNSLVCANSFAKSNNTTYELPFVDVNGKTSSYNFTVNTDSAVKTTFNCGSVAWPNTGVEGAGVTAAMQNIVPTLDSAAKLLVDTKQNQSPNSGKVVDPDRQREVFGEIGSNFINKMSGLYVGTVVNAKTDQDAPKNEYNKFMDNARDIGWIFAGSYFHDIISLASKVSKITVATASPNEPFSDKSGIYDFISPKTDVYFATNFVAQLNQATSSSTGPLDGAVSGQFLPKDKGGHGVVTHCSTHESHVFGIIPTGKVTVCTKDVVNSAGDYIYKDINKAFGFLFLNTNTQPVLALQNVGKSLLHTISTTLSGIVTLNQQKTLIADEGSEASGELSIIPFFGKSLSSMNNAAMQAQLSEMTSFQGLLIALVSALMLPAATLAVYIPMLPYILFTIGVIGWLLTVFEAIVAAPLVSLGIVHPEGHDVYGKAQPAVMLLANAFIKPMLMVVGLLAGILISDAAVTFVNAGFAEVVVSSFSQGGYISTYSSDLALLSVLLLFLYVAIVVMILNKCFQLIYVIPDKVLRWLDNFVPSGQDEGQMLQEVKGEYQQSVNEGKQLGSKGMETSVSMNDAKNKGIQETNTAQWGLVNAGLSGAGGGGKSPSGGGDGADAAELPAIPPV